MVPRKGGDQRMVAPDIMKSTIDKIRLEIKGGSS
jgi:hypothetical protein